MTVAAAVGWPATALAATGPAIVGSTSNPTSLSGAVSVAVSGNFAYTTAYWPGQLTVLDISNPNVPPPVVGSTPPTTSLENGSNVTIVANEAFVVSKNRNASMASNDDGSGNSLTVVNISDPTHPTVLGTVHDATELFGAYGIAVQGHYAFVAAQGLLAGQPSSPDTGTGSFAVIDLNNLAAGVVAHLDNNALPNPWTGQNVFDHATSVAISGSNAYVTAFYDKRVTVVDISNPLTPTIVTSVGPDATNLPFPADLAAQGNYLYVANQVNFGNQFTVVNISDPASPQVVGSLNNGLLQGAYRIHVRGAFAYVSGSGSSTIARIDVSNPAAPTLAGSVSDPRLNKTTGLDLDSSGNYVIASSPYTSTQSNVTYPPFPGSGGTIDTGTVSIIDLSPAAPANSSVPIVSGSTSQDATLNAAPGAWTGSPPPSFSYQWSRCDAAGQNCAQIPGATGQAYTAQRVDVGSTLEVTVSAANAIGSAVAVSTPTALIAGAPANSSPPTVSGNASQGATLTAAPGSWTGAPSPSFSYHWSRCNASGQTCTAILGAAGHTYTAQAADGGSTLEVVVTAANSAGSAAATSSPTAIVTATPRGTAAPQISGRLKPGGRLTGTNGSWTGYPAPGFADHWQRCNSHGASCRTIAGQTKARYTVASSDLGSTLRFVVTATNSLGSASASSAATAVVGGAAALLVPTRHATLTGLSGGKPKLLITLSGSPEALLTRVIITLPGGLGLSSSRKSLRNGITVRGPHRARLRFIAKIVRGALVLTLRRATVSLRLQIHGPALKVSTRIAINARKKHARPLLLTLTLAGDGVPNVRARVRLSLG